MFTHQYQEGFGVRNAMVRDSVWGKTVVMLHIHTFSRDARGCGVKANTRCKTVVIL